MPKDPTRRPPVAVIAWAGLALAATAAFPTVTYASATNVAATADPTETVTETVKETVTETVTQTETVTEPGPTHTVVEPGPTVTDRVTVTAPPPGPGPKPPPRGNPRPAPNARPAPVTGNAPRSSGSAGVGTLMRAPLLSGKRDKKGATPDRPVVLPYASAPSSSNIDLPFSPSAKPIARKLDAWGTDNPALMSWALAVPAAAGAISILLAILALRRRIRRVRVAEAEAEEQAERQRLFLWGGEPFRWSM